MTFEDLPPTPRAETILDVAFSRGTRAGSAQGGAERHRAMVRTATDIASNKLDRVVTAWPNFDTVDPFYLDLAGLLVDIDEVRQHLSTVRWGATKTAEIGDHYHKRILEVEPETAAKLRKQAFARIADVVEETDEALAYLERARAKLIDLPAIDPEEPAIVLAGSPNVGKSTFLNMVTNASVEVAEYPFTTTTINVGHVERDHIRYQLIDTPGLLDRPASERNEIEGQALSAIEHAADALLFFYDPSESCGYPLEDQRALEEELRSVFASIKVVTVANKADLHGSIEADATMSLASGENVEEVLSLVIEATGYEPTLPFEEDASPANSR